MNRTRFFRHYKNKPYRYLGIVHHSETLEEMALYETLYDNKLGKLWVRPKEMFFENILIEGQKKPRFEPIEFQFLSFSKVTDVLLNEIKNIYKSSFKSDFNEAKYLSKLQLHRDIHLGMAYEKNIPIGFKIGYLLDQSRFYSWLGAVVPEYQGLGVSSELMRLQHNWCLEQQIKFVETRCRNNSRQMISLNLKFGFDIVGTIQDSKGLKILFEKELV